MTAALEGNVTPRCRMSSGTVDEVTEAWAFIGVCAVAWWAAKHAWRAAVRSVS